MIRPRLLLVLVLLPLLAACAVNPVTGKNELALFAVSPEEEIGLGQKAFPQAVQQMGGAYPDAALARYVEQVGLGIARFSERPELPWQFQVVNDSAPNAFALPGGKIAITRGLLVNLQSEAELAAVLGHEIGHVTARHSVAGMQRGTLLNVGLAVLAGATEQSTYGILAQQAGSLAASLLDKTYSREQERESDRLGIDYMVKAGYDPQGALQLQEFFFRQLEGGSQGNWLAGMFRTHPFSAERLADCRSYIAQSHAATLGNPRYRLQPKPLLAATERLRGLNRAYALYDEAQQLERSGDPRRALAVYQQAAALAPEESLILTGLGMASLQAKDLAAANQHLGKAIKLDGRYYQARLGLGYVLLQQGEVARAVGELEASMQLLPTLQGGYLLGEGYEKSGRRAQALEQYRAVAAADPDGQLGKSAAQRLQALETRQ